MPSPAPKRGRQFSVKVDAQVRQIREVDKATLFFVVYLYYFTFKRY